jgi:S1-C subfamily serine protease
MSVDGKDYPISVEPVTFAERRPSAGDAIATSGFPLEEPSLVTTAGVLASDMTHDADQPGRERLLGDLNVNRGNSGGPVYTVKDAKVIGVCIKGRLALAETVTGPSTLGTMAGLCSIVPADVIDDFLRASGVDPSTTQSPSGRRASSRGGKRR